MVYRSDELAHYGTLGMKWGQRNGPPYPLQRFQKAASDAIIKGKRAMGDAYEREKVKYKVKKVKKAEKRKAEKEDLDKRKADLARRKRLSKMPLDLLTKQEIDELTNRKRSEDSYKDVFSKKKKNKDNGVNDVRKTLVKDLIGTPIIEAGKAAVISMLTGKDFRTVAISRIDKAWNQKDNNNDNNNNNDNKDKNKDKNKNKGNTTRTYNINLFNSNWTNQKSEEPKKDDNKDKK